MEKTIIASSIPLHIAPGVGCAGVMLIGEPIAPSEVSHESEFKDLHDVADLDENTNERKP